jgi:hypothetical protein
MRLPKFHGDLINHPEESWQKYLNQIDLVYRAAGLTDPTDIMKHAHLLSGLEGKAKQYYEANPRLNDLNCDELKEDLKKKFDKPNLQGLMEIGKLLQKPGESCAEFAARLKEAAKAINVEDDYVLVTKREALAAAEVAGEQDNIRVRKEAVEAHLREQQLFMEKFVFHHFVRGMSEKIRRIILPQHPRTLEKALELAEAEEQYLETYGGLLNEREVNSTHRDETVLEAARQLQALNVSKDKSNDKENEYKGARAKRPFSSSSRPQGHLKDKHNIKTAAHQDLRCFFCARPGHIARDCKTRARYMRNGQGESQCEEDVGRPCVSHMQSPRPPFTRNVAGSQQQGKRISFNLSPREARSTLVEFLSKNQPYPQSKYRDREDRSTWVDFLNKNEMYAHSKNGVCYPPKGGSTTPFPFRGQAKYQMRR